MRQACQSCLPTRLGPDPPLSPPLGQPLAHYPALYLPSGLLQGKGEIDQVKQIFAVLGTPTQEEWPGWDELPYFKTFKVRDVCAAALRKDRSEEIGARGNL